MSVAICLATLLERRRDPSPDEVARAVDAALAAGFTTASVPVSLVPAVHGRGLHVACVEGARAWSRDAPGGVRAESERLADAVSMTGAGLVLAVTLDAELPDARRAAEDFGALVGEMGAAGARVGLEFVPWSAFPSLARAWDFVRGFGPGAGIVIDAWHWVRQPGGPDPRSLRQLPAAGIGCVQLCDVRGPARAPDVRTEAMGTWRLLPGDGEVDFATLGAALRTTAASPLLAVEVFDVPLVRERGPDAAAALMWRAARRIVEQDFAPPGPTDRSRASGP